MRKLHGKSEIIFSGIKEEISSAADGYHWPIELQEKSVSTNQNPVPRHQCLLLKNELKNCSEKGSPKVVTLIKRAVSQKYSKK